MQRHYKAKPADLVKAWAISRGPDTRQLTIRVPNETFYKIQALEAMFPDRSRNEMVADLLSTALDEFEEGLPFEEHEGDIVGYDPENEPFRDYWTSGPKADFRRLIEEAKAKVDLKAVDSSEVAA